MTAMSNQRTEVLLLIFLSFLWGSSFTLNEVALTSVPPATIVLGRLVIGAMVLWMIVRLHGIEIPLTPSTWGAFAVQGFLQSALPFTLISWGQQHIDSGLAGLLNSLPPLFAFLITFLVLGNRNNAARNFIGVAVGLTGIVATLGPDAITASSWSLWGQAAVIGSSVSYAVAPIYARRFHDQPAILTAACSMTVAALMMAPVSLFADRPWILTPSPLSLFAVAALGIFSTGLAMIIYFRLVKTLGPLGVTSGSYLRAGFSVAFGVLLLGEPFTPSLAIGFVLILLSVAIITGQLRLARKRLRVTE